MKLDKTESGNIEPVTRKDLFMHCAGGLINVTEEYYFKTVEPLLIMHGVSTFDYLWGGERIYVSPGVKDE